MFSRWSRLKAGCAFALACVLPCAFTPGAFAADDGRWPVANDVVAAAGKQVEVVRSERPIDCPYIGLDDGGVANERVVVRLVQTQRFAAVMLPFDCRDVIKTGQ